VQTTGEEYKSKASSADAVEYPKRILVLFASHEPFAFRIRRFRHAGFAYPTLTRPPSQLWHGTPIRLPPATIPPRWSLPVSQSLHSRTGCICEGRGEESVGPFLGEPARVSEDDLNLGVPDLQACQHMGEPSTWNML
jgi:hypothetical protein